jgi:hypothetical protein
MTPSFDVDAALDNWKEVQAMDAGLLQLEKAEFHRCPPDMPPCPDCQDRIERENDKEFGP